MGLPTIFALTADEGSLTSPYSKEVSGKIGSSGGDTGSGGTGLVAAYGFEENDGNNTASDASGNGHDGTL
jgi:phage baseplate assembly protein gpV